MSTTTTAISPPSSTTSSDSALPRRAARSGGSDRARGGSRMMQKVRPQRVLRRRRWRICCDRLEHQAADPDRPGHRAVHPLQRAGRLRAPLPGGGAARRASPTSIADLGKAALRDDGAEHARRAHHGAELPRLDAEDPYSRIRDRSLRRIAGAGRAVGRSPGRGAHGRGDVHRLGHPRLPRPGFAAEQSR